MADNAQQPTIMYELQKCFSWCTMSVLTGLKVFNI